MIKQLWIGDETNKFIILEPVSRLNFVWNNVDYIYRVGDGSIRRYIVRRLIPVITCDFSKLSPKDRAILLGFKDSQQILFIRFNQAVEVKNLLLKIAYYELQYSYLPVYFSVVPNFVSRIYYKSNINSGYEPPDVGYDETKQAFFVADNIPVGTEMYIDFEFNVVKCILTDLNYTHLAGKYKQFVNATVKFEGI